MVSLRFLGSDCVSKSNLFSNCVLSCRKVNKLEIQETKINLDYVKVIEQCFNNENSARFLGRVKHFILTDIEFTGDNDMQRDFAVNKFCQNLAKFTNLEILELNNVTCLHQIVKFYKSSEK